jgi:hypothetical protein
LLRDAEVEKGEIRLKRYFDIADKRQTMELDIKDGSQAAAAPAEAFRKVYRMDMREINKAEYDRLSKEYTK